MPFKSKRQSRACFATHGFGGKVDCKQWGDITDYDHLPEKTKKKEWFQAGEFKGWLQQYQEIWPAFAAVLARELAGHAKKKQAKPNDSPPATTKLKDGRHIQLMSTDPRTKTASGLVDGRYVTVPMDQLDW